MKKKIVILIICFIYLFIVSLGFKYISLYVNEYTDEDINLIDTPVVNLGPTSEEIINDYIDKYNNEDVVGEIKIINTNYEKAIMQGKDNEYYLNHLEDKTSHYMGSIYLDFRINIDNGNKLLIYGHNSSNIDMPFKILEKYYDEEYYKSHKYIQITTKDKTRLYEIYSIFVEVSDFSYMKTEFKDKDEWYKHIKDFKDKSMFDTGVLVNEEDNILILQTCSTHLDYRMYNKKYLLIVGKEINNI